MRPLLFLRMNGQGEGNPKNRGLLVVLQYVEPRLPEEWGVTFCDVTLPFLLLRVFNLFTRPHPAKLAGTPKAKQSFFRLVQRF